MWRAIIVDVEPTTAIGQAEVLAQAHDRANRTRLAAWTWTAIPAATRQMIQAAGAMRSGGCCSSAFCAGLHGQGGTLVGGEDHVHKFAGLYQLAQAGW
jgi:hypothetical protein